MHCRAMDELLNEEIFDTLDDARRKLALWRYDYNNPSRDIAAQCPERARVRPHSFLGNQTPAETPSHGLRCKPLPAMVERLSNLRAPRMTRLLKLTTKNMKSKPANSRYK
jgi:hypothetical protein